MGASDMAALPVHLRTSLRRCQTARGGDVHVQWLREQRRRSAGQGLPFCVAGVGDLLALFRCISCRYCFGTDATKPELLGAPGRVFTTQEVRAWLRCHQVADRCRQTHKALSSLPSLGYPRTVHACHDPAPGQCIPGCNDAARGASTRLGHCNHRHGSPVGRLESPYHDSCDPQVHKLCVPWRGAQQLEGQKASSSPHLNLVTRDGVAARAAMRHA